MKTKLIALLSEIIGLGACGAASAADMAVKARPVPVPIFTWSGMYIGGQVGYGWDRLDYTTNDHTLANLENVRVDGSGWLAGGQLGARWQTGAYVFGLEAAGNWANIGGSGFACGVGVGALPCTTPVVTVAAPFLESRATEIRSLYAFTGQIGYAWNRTLLYAKGGFAGGELRTTNFLTNAGAPACNVVNAFPSCASASRQAWGGTVGAGIEYAVTDNFSIGAEYAYYRLTTDPVALVSSTGLASTFGAVTADVHTVVGRANYKFWTFGAPVVAKY